MRDFDPRGCPIPVRDRPPTALDYKTIPVDLGDPLSREVLVDLATLGIAGRGYYARRDGLNPPYHRSFPSALPSVWCRESVAQRLVQVDDFLRPYGVELYVLNGFRPIATQSEPWRFFIDRAKVVLDDPGEEECIAFGGEYCSDPSRRELIPNRDDGDL